MGNDDITETDLLDHRLVEKLDKDEIVPMDLYTACMIGDYSIVSKYVSEQLVDLNRKNKYGGWTLLMYAAFVGRDTIVNLLLEVDVDVNATAPKTGITALMLASDCGNESVAYFLLQQGADIDAKDKKGQTALFHAVEGGHINVVKLLIEADANIEESQAFTKLTPLMMAATEGHAVIFNMLLEYGADVNAKSQFGENAYSLAVKYDNITIINIIENMCRSANKDHLRGEPGLFDHDVGIRDGPQRIAQLAREAREASLRQYEHSDVMRTRDMVSPIDAGDYEPVESWNNSEFSRVGVDLEDQQAWPTGGKVYYQSDGAGQALKGDVSQTIIIPARKRISRICFESPKQPFHVGDKDGNIFESLSDILQDLNLTKYKPCFENEDIDLDTFVTLTDDDLKQIGIDKLGPRKKIVSFMAKLKNTKGEDNGNNREAEQAIQKAHAFVEYLQAQVYKEKQGRHELESYFISQRTKMDQITKLTKQVQKSLDETKTSLESLRSSSKKTKSELCLVEKESKSASKEHVKRLIELQHEADKLIESLADKVQTSLKANEQTLSLCTDHHRTESS